MAFNPLNFPLVTQSPRLLSEVSAWVEHIPFAFALVQLLQPRVLVELGTHQGDSYCAFCQAIDVLGLDARAFAVDTWVGDAQAGHYSQHVLRDLRAHHDHLYGRFSTLLQSTFDEAIAGFEDASIDLLHIDGLHTYDAVKHDFQSWRPKLSPRAVVIFHDTAINTGDFGVCRLWSELRKAHPSFEFLHGSGLGILAVGREPSPFLLQFLREARANPEPIRSFFAILGQRLALARALAFTLGQAQRDYQHIVSWRHAVGLTPRQPMPDGFDIVTLLQIDQAPERVIAALAEVRHNADDVYALVRDDEAVRAALDELCPRPGSAAAQSPVPDAAGGEAHG